MIFTWFEDLFYFLRPGHPVACLLKFEETGHLLLLCGWFSGGLLDIIAFLCCSWSVFSMVDTEASLHDCLFVSYISVIIASCIWELFCELQSCWWHSLLEKGLKYDHLLIFFVLYICRFSFSVTYHNYDQSSSQNF